MAVEAVRCLLQRVGNHPGGCGHAVDPLQLQREGAYVVGKLIHGAATDLYVRLDLAAGPMNPPLVVGSTPQA